MDGEYLDKTDVIIVANVFIPSSANASSGVLLGARLGRGGCNMQSADGVYAILDATAGTFELVVQVGGKNYSKSYDGPINIPHGTWFNFGLALMGNQIIGLFDTDTAIITFEAPATPTHGFVGYGTLGWGETWFDDFTVDKLQSGFSLKYGKPELRHIENIHPKLIKL